MKSINTQRLSHLCRQGYKEIYARVRPFHPSVPIFVFGRQRSGTTMLMRVFEQSYFSKVYGETDPRAFTDYQIHDLKIIERLIEKSPFRYSVFKPLCDSYRVLEFIRIFPSGKFIWMYRNYRDNVNSSMRKFPDVHQKMEKIFKGITEDNWFYKYVTEETNEILKNIEGKIASVDHHCLIWWMRNKILLDEKIYLNKRVYILSYDDFVSNPEQEFTSLQSFLGWDLGDRIIQKVHSKSLNKNHFPQINHDVDDLCVSLWNNIECIKQQNRVLHSSVG
jgi:hypothetical protein